jgi:excinuclease ABC subunit A
MVTLKEGMALSRYHEHTIELVIGRSPSKNLDQLVAKALKEGNGSLILMDRRGTEEVFSLSGICPTCGIGLEQLDPRLFSFNSKQGACTQCGGLGVSGYTESEDEEPIEITVCDNCGGSRLKPQALAVKVGGHSIWDLVKQPARDIFDDTLSGGEAQRVRLAAQLGSNLTGVCYILDEPTIGLHARDNRILIGALQTLRDRGNSILVVEHDEETIRAADTIIDLAGMLSPTENWPI